MFPDEFDYYRASDVDEAIDLLAEHADAETELLAGGQSLLPTIKSGLASPEVVVDISGIDELAGIEVREDAVTFGAGTTYVDALDHDDAMTACPDFMETVAEIGDLQVRNVGTIGGNLAHADPASDLPGAALAADATFHVRGPDGERTIDAEDFFVAMYTTALGPTDVLTSVEVPTLAETDAGAYVKKSSPSSGYAMIGVAVRLRTDGAEITDARVAANGAFEMARRLPPVEEALVGRAVDDTSLPAEAGAEATTGVEEWELMDDVQVSSEFRGHLLEVYTERALERARDRIPAAQPA